MLVFKTKQLELFSPFSINCALDRICATSNLLLHNSDNSLSNSLLLFTSKFSDDYSSTSDITFISPRTKLRDND